MYAGPYTIVLKISDLQGKFGVYNINVTVCDCSVTPNCRIRRNTATKAATGAIGIVFASLFLLLCKNLNHCRSLVLEYTVMHIVTVLITHCKLHFVFSVLLLVLLLLAFTMTSKKEFTTLQTDDSFGETLLASNVERPGTDCKVTAQKHLQINQ